MRKLLERCGVDDWTDGDYLLKQTCLACPEQYDMLDKEGNTVGYFRLRHGHFRVEYPDCGGKEVFSASPDGDGLFENYEREYYLTLGYLSVLHEIKLNGIQNED